MRIDLPPCILFDLDGTLIDSLPGIEFSVQKALSTCGFPLATRSLRELIGPPIRTILSRAGNVPEGAALDAVEREFRVSYDDEGWHKSSCYPQAEAVLQMMRERGHRLFVVTNKPRQSALPILKKAGILQYFETVVARDSGSFPQCTKEKMIGTLLVERSIVRDQCVVIGDTLEDATAAARAGIRFILMTHGYGNPRQIPPSYIWHTMNNFSEFLHLIMKETVLD